MGEGKGEGKGEGEGEVKIEQEQDDLLSLKDQIDKVQVSDEDDLGNYCISSRES
jgi:hypothetical protein